MLPKGGMALAVLEDIPIEDHILELQPGDRLLCYTDGVTEAFSPGEEVFGEKRLFDLLTGLKDQPIHDTLDTVVNAIAAFRKDNIISDDMTLLGIRRKDTSSRKNTSTKKE